MATIAEVQADIDTARTAIKAGNWSEAHSYALSAQAGLMTIPDVKVGGAETAFDRQSFKSVIDELVRQTKSAVVRTRGTFRVTKIRNQRVSS